MTMRTMKVLVWTAVVTAVTIGMIGAARAEVFDQINTKGNAASAFFDQMTPIDCGDGTTGTVELFVAVNGFAIASRSRQLPDTDTNTVFALMSRSNSCTGDFVVGQTTIDNAFSQTALQRATI